MSEAHTHKMVNGRRVALTTQEIAARQAEEAQWEPTPAQRRGAQLRSDPDLIALSELLIRGTPGDLDHWVDSRGAAAALKLLLRLTALRFL